ncbi:MAG: ABC transporter ATP-binding protein, partial [Phyllobacterium sp.]
AIMKSGRIVQYDTPETVLSHPADGFVENFVGIDRAIKRLSLFTVTDAMNGATPRPGTGKIAPTSNLRDALALMVAANSDELAVVDATGTVQGQLTREAIFSV